MAFGRYYKQIKSTNNVSLTKFSSEIAFEFKTGMMEYIDVGKSYVSVRLRIAQNTTSTAAVDTCLTPVAVTGNSDFIPYLCKNPVMSVFNNAKLSINDKIITNMSDIASTNTLIRLVCPR